jgi:hypothetical protein
MATSETPLPKDEWDFTGPQFNKTSLWQWNDWLNYEYARSCRPIVEAVIELRAKKIPELERGSFPPPTKFPRHALYLAKHYPDFPLKPWLQLPEPQRNLRKENAGQVGGPFEEGVLEVWDAFDFAYRIATGDIGLDPKNLTDHKYAVFKIDFLRDKKMIGKKFRLWLKRRQTEYLKNLQKRTEAMNQSPSRPAIPPIFINEVHSGQKKNKRNYVVAFKQLAALRLLEHFQYDYQKCGYETLMGPRSKPLYFSGNNTRWFQASDEAAARLVRFNIMWTLEAEPAYFFKFGEFHEVLKWHPKLTGMLMRTKSRDQLREHMKTLFCGYTAKQQICGLANSLHGR